MEQVSPELFDKKLIGVNNKRLQTMVINMSFIP